MRRPSCAGVDLVVLVMTSLTFDTTEVFILSANSAVTLATASVRAPVSLALTACWCAVFFVLALGACGACAAAFFGVALTAAAFTAGSGVSAPGPARSAGFAAGAFLAAGRDAGLAAAGVFALGSPAILLDGADVTALAAPVLTEAPPAAGPSVFLAVFVTLCFILPSRCLPLAAMACWQFSRRTKVMHKSLARHIKPCRKAMHHKTGIVYTKHCSKPRIKTSLGKFLPINTILLPRSSVSPHFAPKSLPIIWCTPWKTTLRSAPSISSTPL